MQEMLVHFGQLLSASLLAKKTFLTSVMFDTAFSPVYLCIEEYPREEWDTEINTPIGILPAEEGMVKHFLQKHEVSSEPGCQIAITLILRSSLSCLFYILYIPRQMFRCKVVHKY